MTDDVSSVPPHDPAAPQAAAPPTPPPAAPAGAPSVDPGAPPQAPTGPPAGPAVGPAATPPVAYPAGNSWTRSKALVRASWDVLRQDRELLALPLVSAACLLVVGLLFAAGTFGILAAGAAAESTWVTPLAWALDAVGYFVATFFAIFFQSALVLAADERLRGGNPSLGSALSAAWARRRRIAEWSAVSATVSLVLRSIERRAGIIGSIVVSIVGMAWALVTMLVLPMMVLEDIGPREAVRRSADAFKRTWGENVVGNAGISVIAALVTLAGMLVAVGLGVLAAAAGVPALAVVPAVAFVLLVVVVATVAAAMSAVFRTALYHYAVNGHVVPGFTADQLGGAVRPRRRLGRRG